MNPSTPSPFPLGLRVLIVDDEKNIRTSLRICLEALGCEVLEATSPETALAAMKQGPLDLVFLDLKLGTASGMALLPRMLSEAPSLDVVLITAYATFDAAVEGVKLGARDFLPKPFTPAQISHLVKRTRERRALTFQVDELEARIADSEPARVLDTASTSMRAALDLVARAAPSDAAVLLRGESGTGKGVLARLLHSLSPRKLKPFVTVNCPTLSEQLLSSELFGHARGAFTGAVRDQLGRVERAEGGTLFLDEVAEMSPALQAQLLRFVQEKQFERLGEGRTRVANVRVVAATNKVLEREVADGRFREDLFYRLNVVEVTVPALRQRREDILPLARGFSAFFARASQRRLPTFSAATETMLGNHTWPGNVRELRNAIERALIVSKAEVIEPQAFPERIAAAATVSPPTLGGPHSLEAIEREHVLRVLAASPSLDEASRLLGIDASTLYRKRRKWESPDS